MGNVFGVDNVTSDNVTSDNNTSDNNTSDNNTSDNVTSDNVTSDNVTSDNVSKKRGCYDNYGQGLWQQTNMGRYYSCDNDGYNEDGYNIIADTNEIYHKNAKCYTNQNINNLDEYNKSKLLFDNYSNYRYTTGNWGINYMLNRCDKADNCKGISTNKDENNLTSFCMYTDNQIQNITNLNRKDINNIKMVGNLYKKGPLQKPNYSQYSLDNCIYNKSKSGLYPGMYEINVRVKPSIPDRSVSCPNPGNPSVDCLRKKCDGFVKIDGKLKGIRCGGEFSKNIFDRIIINDKNAFTCDNNSTVYLNPNMGWLININNKRKK